MAKPIPVIKDEAAIYLQIQKWMDLEEKVRELQDQLEKATTDQLAAEIRADQATRESMRAKAAEQKALEELKAAGEEETTETEAPEKDDQEEMARLDQILKAVTDLRVGLDQVRGVAEAARVAAATPQPMHTPEPMPFEIDVLRNEVSGRLRKLVLRPKKGA